MDPSVAAPNQPSDLVAQTERVRWSHGFLTSFVMYELTSGSWGGGGGGAEWVLINEDHRSVRFGLTGYTPCPFQLMCRNTDQAAPESLIYISLERIRVRFEQDFRCRFVKFIKE